MFNKLRTVIYHVDDIAAAKEWYIKATGIKPYFDQPFYVGFNINGFELGLDPDTSGIVAGNHSTALWDVSDMEQIIKKLEALGAKIVQPRTKVGENMHVATVEDPFGNHIGLIEGE